MWEIDRLKKSFNVLLDCSEKMLKKMTFVSDAHFKEDSLNFNFSIASTMVTYFPSQTSSNLMIVTLAQSFWLGSKKSLITDLSDQV